MGLDLEFFYTPDYVTWGDDGRSEAQQRITIADRSTAAGDYVIIGGNEERMRSIRLDSNARRHYVLIPQGYGRSRVAAVLRWYREGLAIDGHGRNAVEVRTWGRQHPTLLRMGQRERELDPRVVGRVPGGGAWFRTVVTDNFEVRASSRATDETEVEGEDHVHPGILRHIFFCPGFEQDGEHAFLEEGCPEPQHDERRMRLSLVVAYYLRWLTPPPPYVHVPHEEHQYMMGRYRRFGLNTAPTKPRDALLKQLQDEAALQATEANLIDLLVGGGILTWRNVRPLVEYMESVAPVQWSVAPKGAGHISRLGIGGTIKVLTP